MSAGPAPSDGRDGDVDPWLSARAIRIYRQVASRGPLAQAALLAQEEAPSTQATIAELTDLGLLTVFGDGQLMATDPRSLSNRLLEPWEHRLKEAQTVMLRLQGQLAEMALMHDVGKHSIEGPQIELLDSLDDVTHLLDQCSVECREEVLAAQPGGARPPEQLKDARGRDRTLLRRGVQLRSLYQYSARFDPPTVAYAEEVTAFGAEIRTVSSGLPRMIVFDAKTMFLPRHGHPGTAIVVRNPDLIAFGLQVFEVLWATGDRIERRREKELLRAIGNRTKVSILQQLMAGKDDRATARALGISVRTCQRHVSEIMASLGASSRFQLGGLVQEHGLLDKATELAKGSDQ